MKTMRWIVGFALAALLATSTVRADDSTVTVGLILPMTGPWASTGKQVRAAVELYIAEHGDAVAGKRISLVVKDDGGATEVE